MQTIIVVVVFLCGVQIILSQGQKRLNWFLCSLLLIYSSILVIQKPHITAHRFLILTYWFSVFYHKEGSAVRGFPFKSLLFFYAITLLISCISAPQLTIFYKIYKPFMLMIDTYLLLMIGFNYDSRQFIVTNELRIVIYVVTVYGLICYILQTDILRQILYPDFLESYYFGERRRVASTWSHPIAYGYICSLLSLLLLNDYMKRDKIVLLLLLAANIFVCGSRTAIVCYFVMLLTYWLFAYDWKRKFQFLLSALLFATLLLGNNLFRDKVNDVVLSATGEEKVSGSSIEMRTTQTEAVMVVAANSPVIGHGIDYIHEVMGFGTDKWVDTSYEFAGFESFFFSIIIERGWLGVAAEAMMLLFICFTCFKHRESKKASAFTISTILGFVIFSIMTGKLDTSTLTFFTVGIMLKRVYGYSNQNKLRISNKTLE